MARPTATRVNQRVQVQADIGGTPAYQVQEQIQSPNTDLSPEAQSWNQLLRAMNVAAPFAGKYDAKQKQQGYDDAMLGKENKDPSLLQRISKYSEGVTTAHTVVQTQSALDKVEVEIQQLPNYHEMSPEERAHVADAMVMKELGPLAEDATARKVIAPMYHDWMQRFSGQNVEEVKAQNQATAEQAAAIRTSQFLNGDNGDVGEFVNSIAGAYKGGRAEAWKNVINNAADLAEANHDETYLDRLPSKVKTEDGQTIDSPVNSGENKARIALARARIAAYKQEQAKPEMEWAQAQYLRPFEDRAQQGLPIQLVEFKDGIAKGLITAEKANSLINAANAKALELQKKNADRNAAWELRRTQGGDSWLDFVGVDKGPKNPSEAQDWTNEDDAGFLRVWAQGKTDQQGNPIAVPQTGEQIKQHPDVADELFNRTLKQRLPYEPMKQWFSEVNPAMGKTVIDRLDMYRLAKAKGVENIYVPDPTQQAVYEAALGAIGSGEKPDQVMQTIQHMADPSVRKQIADGHKEALKAALTGDWDVTNRFFDEKQSKEIRNFGYMQTKVSELADLYLSRGLPPAKAGELAHAKFADTHFAVNLNGQTVMVPVSKQYDEASAAVALEQSSELAAAYATKQGDPHPENATLTVVFGRNGRDTEVHFLGSDGLELNSKPISINALIDVSRKAHPSDFKKMVDENRDGQARRRLLARPNSTLLSQPKY